MDDVVVDKTATIERCVQRVREVHDGRDAALAADAPRAMVGLRNIAVHAYTHLNMQIVRAVIERHTVDLLAFAASSLRAES